MTQRQKTTSMTKEEIDKLILPHKTPEEATEKALQIVREERSGVQLGLYTKFNLLNTAVSKYFRFNTVNLWGGLSGHGKSYFLNMITTDFLDKDNLNKSSPYLVTVFHFCFEMSSYNEILRSVAKDLGVNYNYLLSSDYNAETQEYNRITDEELLQIELAMEYYKNQEILFFDVPGNVYAIYYTVHHHVARIKKKAAQLGLEARFVINIDHTLLIEALPRQEAVELMAEVGKLAIKLRKETGAMLNLLGQLNNKIEDTNRLIRPELHYPQKSDIFAAGQVFNACDNVFVIHQPMLLKIMAYGTRQLPTNGLIHLIRLKARHGSVGSLWFENRLHEGKIVEIDLKPKNQATIPQVEDDEGVIL